MSRKFRNTEISGNVNTDSRQHGQYMHANWFCINCHAINSQFGKHYPNCTKRELYAIPATAEAPKKDAPKKKWEIFKKQFVYAKPLGFWSYYHYSWWYKNKCQTK